MIINTPIGRQAAHDIVICAAALDYRVPTVTTLAGARAAVEQWAACSGRMIYPSTPCGPAPPVMSVSTPIAPGTDIRSLFAEAYNNRYTWAPALPVTAAAACGAKAINGWKAASGGSDLKAEIEGISNEGCTKLWPPSAGRCASTECAVL